jgi:hypothetical protein
MSNFLSRNSMNFSETPVRESNLSINRNTLIIKLLGLFDVSPSSSVFHSRCLNKSHCEINSLSLNK